MWEVFLLAVVSAFWPALVAVALVALASPRPKILLASFLAGGLLTTTAIGLAIALSLEGSSIFTGSHPPAPPAVNIVAGVLLLVVAHVAAHRNDKTSEQQEPAKAVKEPWTKRMLDRGTGRIAFLVGIVINLVPGVFAVVGYTDIARLDYSTTETVLLVLGFNVIMFALIEVPLVGYAVAPRRTTAGVTRLNAWLKGNARRLIVLTAVAAGIFLIARGLLQLIF
ncbi:MAG: hypothetical protein C5B48_08910 [Candidatus Rokuibacteriota bacterium]|nr:MAG: hypothetical protein C5B48_08910 [Candidatus Rokubacteria bacterium]